MMRIHRHNITIPPTRDSINRISKITSRFAGKTKWWYKYPNDIARPIAHDGRYWRCLIPSVEGMRLEADDVWHSLATDLVLSGATIWNSYEQ